MKIYKVFRDDMERIEQYSIEEILIGLGIETKRELMNNEGISLDKEFRMMYYEDIKRVGLRQVIVTKDVMMNIYANLIDSGYILRDISVFKNNPIGNENNEYLKSRYGEVFDNIKNLVENHSAVNMLKFHRSILNYDEMEIGSMKFSKNDSLLSVGINGMIIFDEFDDEDIRDINDIILMSVRYI